MKSSLILLFGFLTICLTGQNKYLSLGTKEFGICFGNSTSYNGVRLNFRDHNSFKVNGLNISGLSEANKYNGVSVGILALLDSVSNGINIGGIVVRSKKHNGLAIGGLGLSSTKFNGVGLSGLIVRADTMNGMFFGTLGVMNKDFSDTIRLINGFTVGGGVRAYKINGVSLAYLVNMFEEQNGVAIAGINITHELHGFQFGLINCALNNRKLFRWTPLINFNIRKKINDF